MEKCPYAFARMTPEQTVPVLANCEENTAQTQVRAVDGEYTDYETGEKITGSGGALHINVEAHREKNFILA